ncbi:MULTISPECIES: nuclear transport factor 2 family protein [unclassified Sphingomonas]|uniref:nuclear transport factor 2 family protein n=1 Tax=unclassified Sphingomonas TaxID=196159 RepID=UPI00226A5DD6|nr:MULTISPECIES: nuclear transport factor 2 family protein [unclassified Sphingomonas]
MDQPLTPSSTDISHLVDKEDVRLLVARYVACIDRGWLPDTFDPDAFDSIFMPNATYDLPALGVRVEGLDAIKASLIAETSDLTFSQHSLADPVIVIDGDEATSDWKMWIVSERQGETRLVLGRLHVICIRQTSDWRIAEVTLSIGGTVPLAQTASVAKASALNSI